MMEVLNGGASQAPDRAPPVLNDGVLNDGDPLYPDEFDVNVMGKPLQQLGQGLEVLFEWNRHDGL